MKKKIFGGIAILALATVIGINVKMNQQENKLADLALQNVEALGAENGGENSGWDWWSQGATKDEWTETKQCTEGVNLIVYYVEWEGTRVICHNGGSENCSTQICGE